jgi:hypothetical protein
MRDEICAFVLHDELGQLGCVDVGLKGGVGTGEDQRPVVGEKACGITYDRCELTS